jgi:fructokinase
MYKVYSIGELLIDFMPTTQDALKDVPSFIKAAGGAPANVSACVAILGGHSQFIGQVGLDAFGDYLKQVLSNVGVNVDTLYQTKLAKTALAFVSLTKEGQRDFAFYRQPSADMLLKYDTIKGLKLNQDILHFCSVSLTESDTKQTHVKLIDDFIESKGIISFDPNLRFSLWADLDALKQTVNAFIPKADIVKVSDEELAFITGLNDVETAIQSLFIGRVKAVVYTKGAQGSNLYLKSYKQSYRGFKVDVVDTTGAGDAFIGALLYQLQCIGKPLDDILITEWDKAMYFANAVGALTTTKKGAITSIPTNNEVNSLLSSLEKMS